MGNEEGGNGMAEITLSIQYGDNGTQAMYIKVKDGKVSKTLEVSDDLVLDLNSRGAVLGIEILSPKAIRFLNKIANNMISDLMYLLALER